ncbi:kinase [Micromonospora sp. URMC 106]|jgi:guanylate kinase|uniref:kinase n=1 Tax=Micromonospora sp. URMC 106 TaxID=3423408 RepID=UPI003F1D001E
MNPGIILYGPPAVGKDTITRCLEALHERYALFPRLKAGRGRTNGYRATTPAEIEELRRRGDILWEDQRQGATYAIDRSRLTARLAEHVPVVHLGQVGGIDAVTGAIPGTRWVVVFVWCPREMVEVRLRNRGIEDPAEALRAWDAAPLISDRADLTINTLLYDPEDAARQIHEYVTAIG